jgi:hypothetical protein
MPLIGARPRAGQDRDVPARFPGGTAPMDDRRLHGESGCHPCSSIGCVLTECASAAAAHSERRRVATPATRQQGKYLHDHEIRDCRGMNYINWDRVTNLVSSLYTPVSFKHMLGGRRTE